jgi:methylenetetrahydrofolate dehydrogenase (NADP+)/methenyltetrahydrofolate cyclohydrolase
MSKVINGKKIRDQKLDNLKIFFKNFEEEKGRRAKLSVFIIGQNKAIDSFVSAKKEVAEKIGVDFEEKRYGEEIEESFLIEEIKKENNNSDGIIIQLPLPDRMNRENVLNAV